MTLHDDQTYAGDGTPVAHPTTHEWSHGLGEIVQGALDAGLVVRGLAEHYYTEWQMLESMVKDADDRWVLPEAPERLPLLFTLQATRPVEAAWHKMMTALAKHEENHRLIFLEEAAKFAEKVTAKTDLTRKVLKPILDQFSKDVKTAQDLYDSKTEHGKKEGVFLPAPDEVKD